MDDQNVNPLLNEAFVLARRDLEDLEEGVRNLSDACWDLRKATSEASVRIEALNSILDSGEDVKTEYVIDVLKDVLRRLNDSYAESLEKM
jgi:hypothetical protein